MCSVYSSCVWKKKKSVGISDFLKSPNIDISIGLKNLTSEEPKLFPCHVFIVKLYFDSVTMRDTFKVHTHFRIKLLSWYTSFRIGLCSFFNKVSVWFSKFWLENQLTCVMILKHHWMFLHNVQMPQDAKLEDGIGSVMLRHRAWTLQTD